MLDLSEVNKRQNSMYCDNIIEEEEAGHSLKSYKSEEYLHHSNPSYASLERLRSPDFVKSNESLSSGYSTDSFLPNSYDLQNEEAADNIDTNIQWEEKLDDIVRAMKSPKSRIEGTKLKDAKMYKERAA